MIAYCSLTVKKQGSGTGDEINIVSACIRVEGYEDTIVPRISISTDNFDLTPYLGPASGSSAESSTGWEPNRLTKPTVAHALIKALESEGIDCTDHAGGLDLQDYGWSLYVAMIAGDREFDIKSTSGWMYRVDKYLPSYGCQEYKLRGDEEIVWYFGVYGFDTWYSELSASKTSAITGEEITLTLTGQKSDLSGGRWEKLKNAAIYVDGSEYRPDGLDILTDENGQAKLVFNSPGSYQVTAERFNGQGNRDLVRPQAVNITVTGENISSGAGNTSGAVEALGNMLESGVADEARVARAVLVASQNLLNDLSKLAGSEDAAKLLENTVLVTGLLEKASEIITADDQAIQFVNSCLNVLDVLAGLTVKVSGEDDRQAIAGAVRESMDAMQLVLGAVTGCAELEAAVKRAIGSCKLLSGFLPDQSALEIQEQIIKISANALEKICGGILPGDKVHFDGATVTAEVNADWAAELVENALRSIQAIETELDANGITANRNFDKAINIIVPSQGADRVEAVLTPGFIDRVAAEGADRVAVNVGAALFNLAPGILGEKNESGNITLSAAVVEPAGLGRSVPAGSMVVDIEIKADGNRIVNLQSPLELSIPYRGTPENAGAVKVFLLKDDGSLELMGGVCDPATGMVSFVAGQPGKYFAMEYAGSFDDMGDYAWAEEAVKFMTGKGIINGKTDNSFGPSANVTRAEFVSMVVKMLECGPAKKEELPFEDVAGDSWYYQAVASAYESGLVSGVAEDRFDPSRNISREEIAAIIARALSSKGYPGGKTAELEAFGDRADISRWAQMPVALTVREEIISGTGAGRFAPRESATRAQAAVMLYRLYGLIN
jgi:hypothetical protein